MSGQSQPNVTALLIAWRKGEQDALSRLTPVVYDELHRLASRYMRGERNGHTLQTTALVHEAYLKLVDSSHVDWQNRAHFFAVAAQLMRRILVDFARDRRSLKRGGEWRRVTLAEGVDIPEHSDPDIVELDAALDSLARLDPRKARAVELRFFGGLSQEETAEALQVSTDTVARDWKTAKAWLIRELRR